MTTQALQASFNSGEWSPQLYARVDLQKYRSGAALLSNFFVDYRGGASTRPGTKYILQCKNSAQPVRLIPFQASFSVGYILEFGQNYVRFYFQGAPVLETATSITAATTGPPEVFTDAGHGYVNGDWLFIANAYYIVANATTNTFTLTDLFGNAITTNPFTLPTAAARVYTIASPYLGSELTLVKFAQNVNTLILCHPNHPPYQLVLTTATSWTLTPITFGTTINPPTSGLTFTTTLSSGSVRYSYVVTSVDSNGQESEPSVPIANATSLQDMSTTAGSNEISWTGVTGAASYNIYKSVVSYFNAAVPSGVQYGFIGNVTGTSIVDTNIAADFSQSPPIAENPFSGSGVQSITLTNAGSGFSAVPTVVISASPGQTATAAASLVPTGTPTIANGGAHYFQGDVIHIFGISGLAMTITSVGIGGVITGVALFAQGASVASGSVPAVNASSYTNSGAGSGALFNVNWIINTLQLVSPGTGYITTPTVAFTGGSPSVNASATAALGAASAGNPQVPGFFQQRLVLAAQVQNPQGFAMSQPGNYYNYDVSIISQADDAITGTLISGKLNTIKSMVPQPAGLLMFTDQNDWLINGGSNGSVVTPSAIVANAQSFNGVSDVPPIVANFDILYVQAKGSIVRDAAYNIYANVYTGTDISILSSHLFYGFTIKEWAWAEEPFKVVWAVRSDGVMLTLTFLKEQEFIGWAHSSTQGTFQSVATVIENTTTAGEVDAIYTVVQRNIQGQTLQYVERVVERTFPNGVASAWCVDCGIGYTGAPATSFTGAQFLGGQSVVGLADGVKIAFTMPTNGSFTLATAASTVTVGLGFTCQLQTLPLELGDPTVQGKVKKINDVDIRVAETLGLQIGPDFSHLVPVKDFQQGQVNSMLTGQNTSQVVTDLFDGDGRCYLGAGYTVPGQYCIQQSDPIPATILGVFPNITLGDGGQHRR